MSDQTEEMIMGSGYPGLYHRMKFYKGSGGKAAHILNLDIGSK
jgi:hypothetical protein